jgi:mono/diheme cytochrome c family protein
MSVRRVLAIVLFAVGLAACSSSEGLTGGDLFQETCSTCHGSGGGGGIGPAIGPGSNADLALTDEQIGSVIRVGPGSMPSFERSLTGEQIESLVVYLRELQSE